MNEELEQNAVETVEEQKPVQEQPKPEVLENNRKLRERAEEAERRLQELERNMSELRSTNSREVEQEEDDDLDVKDDDFIEGKHLKKYIKTLKKELKETRKQVSDTQQQAMLTTAEVKLKSQFSDFDNVVNKDNIKNLAENNPVLYRTIMANPDIYDRGYAAYEILKNMKEKDTYNAIDKRIEENKSKPKTSSSMNSQTADTPLSRVDDFDRRILTPERRKEIMRQVAENKKYR